MFVLSEPLELALEPFDDDICGATIELQRLYPGLQTGRWIIVEGERTDIPATGVRTAELAMIAGVVQGANLIRTTDTIHTYLTLAKPLAYCYRRATATIYGNVAKASHGETRIEPLGSGDATRPLQTFTLRAKPLTYLPDSNALGAASTLELGVDTVRWSEAESLVDLGPKDHGYILKTDDADVTTATTGTGRNGARLSTGQDNVRAVYRSGSGIGGNLTAARISQLISRPLGVSGVINPLPSTGGADRESLEQGRRNLPLGVLSLDRLVSVQDYEDFTRARAGIGQASAVSLSDGARRVVHVTIAGAGDAPIDPNSDLDRCPSRGTSSGRRSGCAGHRRGPRARPAGHRDRCPDRRRPPLGPDGAGDPCGAARRFQLRSAPTWAGRVRVRGPGGDPEGPWSSLQRRQHACDRRRIDHPGGAREPGRSALAPGERARAGVVRAASAGRTHPSPYRPAIASRPRHPDPQEPAVMTTAERSPLMDLLPYIHRLRDEETGGPLGGLMSVIAEQFEALEEDVEGLYADWFIETCRDWVVPYIGELVGYRAGASAVATTDVGSREWQLRARYLVPRRDVANAVGHRRRKGALALLEELAFDVAGWPARAVEHHPLLVVDQHLNHLRLDRGRTVDLRDRDGLNRIGGAFDDFAHAVAAGRIASSHTRRRHNIPNVGMFVWRLQPFSVTRAPARSIDRAKNRFTFDILGVDQPLLTKPIREPTTTHIADELNVPAFIRRIAFDTNTADYYGKGDSLCVYRPAPGARGDRPKLEPIPVSAIVSTDLTGWDYRPRQGQVAIDPVLGRIAFNARESVNRGIWVSYQRAFSAAMGGGEYVRSLRPIEGRKRYGVGRGSKYPTIAKAYSQWEQDRADPQNRDALIEITDNEEYVEAVRISSGPVSGLRSGQHRSDHRSFASSICTRTGRTAGRSRACPRKTTLPPTTRRRTTSTTTPWTSRISEDEDEAADVAQVATASSRTAKGKSAKGKSASASAALVDVAPPTSVAPVYAHPEAAGGQDTGTQDGTSDQPIANPEGSGTQDGTSDGGSKPPTQGEGTSVGGSTPGKPDATGKPESPGKPDSPEECPPLTKPPAPDSPPRLILDGLTIAGRSVRISGQIGMVVIRHSTLVPGWWLDADCCPSDEEEPTSSSTTCVAASSSSTRLSARSWSRGTRSRLSRCRSRSATASSTRHARTSTRWRARMGGAPTPR